LVTGLGAATADALYGFIAAFGLTFISNFLVDQSIRFRIKPQEQTVSVANSTILSAYGTTFFLTLTNPMTILFFAGIFAGLGIVSESIHYASAGLMVIGVFSGSGAWWLLLSGATGIFRNRISEGKLALVNKISGFIILAFGVVALISAAI
jgi:threonine/homoserine/homoserine lactone efflux protein